MTVGLKRGTVVLEEHQSIWEESAEEAMDLLRAVLKEKICAIEHVGSTAVPSIKAKPIIDLAVAVEDLDDVLDKKEELERKVIYLRSVSDEELLLVMGDLQKDTRSHHIHVVPFASKKWKDYLLFRDHLRKNREDAFRYEKLKEELCEKYAEDRASYTKGKEDFIHGILKKAEEEEMDERIEKQLAFALEIDKEKNIFRQTHLSGHGRAENDAEHAWHMAVMAYLFREYANEEVDIAKVMLMCLIHDIVEIDAGDTYAYDAEGIKTQKEREDKAKERIFSLLPEDQKKELISLFDEFEDYVSAESKFAHAMDNLQPLLLNDANDGGDWKQHDVNAKTVYGRQIKTKLGSEKLFEVTDRILKEHIRKGNLKE